MSRYNTTFSIEQRYNTEFSFITEDEREWILSNGFWNDQGYWDDNETWID